jgi:hypothetical protein
MWWFGNMSEGDARWAIKHTVPNQTGKINRTTVVVINS